MTTKKPSKVGKSVRKSAKPKMRVFGLGKAPKAAAASKLKSLPKPKKLRAPEGQPAEGRLRQVAALPLRRREGTIEVLLITSRETHRWVIPKGWPMKKKTDPQAAATEALEESGLLGDIAAEPLGAYAYFKRREEHFDLVDVAVYRLDVTGQEKEWREKDQREQRWCSLEEAAGLVQEPGLQSLLRELAERL